MGLLEGWSDLAVMRRMTVALEKIADNQAETVNLLRRIADVAAPVVADASPEDLKETRVSFSRDAEQGKILDFIDKTYKATGREPSDDEIARFLDGVEV